jgi:hypothetical protein
MRLAANPRHHDLREWALHYGEREWHVLPLVPREKRPLTAQGLLDASPSRRQIIEWWTRWPDANIGIRTGVAFDVLDVDGETARAAIRDAAPEYEPEGPVSATGRGQHWLYLPGHTVNRTGILDKVDWRGTNGYIVAPPSVHPEGHRYAWHPEHGPDTALTQPPAWLTPLLLTYVDREDIVVRKGQYSHKTIVAEAERKGLRVYRGGPGTWRIHCIFHDGDNEPSLVLYDHDQSFHCFGCGAHGDLLDFIYERKWHPDEARR